MAPYLGTMARNWVEPDMLKRLKSELRRRDSQVCGECRCKKGTAEGWCCDGFRDRRGRMRFITDFGAIPFRIPDCRNLGASL